MRFRKRLLAIGAIIAICLMAGSGVAGKEAGIPAKIEESGGGAVVGAGGAAATGASGGVKAADGRDTKESDAGSEGQDGKDKDEGSGEELPDLPEESLKPEVDERETETGAGVEQKELAERSGKTGASRYDSPSYIHISAISSYRRICSGFPACLASYHISTPLRSSSRVCLHIETQCYNQSSTPFIHSYT